MKTTGFNNIIISNDDFTPKNLELTFERLTESGFKRLYFTINHDVVSDPLWSLKDKINKLSNLLKTFRSHEISSHVITNIILTRDSVYEKQIKNLSLKNSNYVFLEFPIFDASDWIDSSINFLLYKQKKFPVFISFEKLIATYDEKFLLHLLATQHAAFMIDINTFLNPNAFFYIKKLIKSDAVIIPGISSSIENYFAIDEKMEMFKNQIGQDLYTQMVFNSVKGSKLIFGL